MNILKIDPAVRINDRFIINSNIDSSPPATHYSHPIIDSKPHSTRYGADFYKKIALDIVTETVFNYPYPYISEKTLRPIACKRMFIIIGAPYTLALLKKDGFLSWGDIVNESYDQIEDPEKRFFAVTDAIKEFCALKDIPLLTEYDSDEFNDYVKEQYREYNEEIEFKGSDFR